MRPARPYLLNLRLRPISAATTARTSKIHSASASIQALITLRQTSFHPTIVGLSWGGQGQRNDA